MFGNVIRDVTSRGRWVPVLERASTSHAKSPGQSWWPWGACGGHTLGTVEPQGSRPGVPERLSDPYPRSGFCIHKEFRLLVAQPSVVPDPRGDPGLDSTPPPLGEGGTTGDDRVEGALTLSSPAPFLTEPPSLPAAEGAASTLPRAARCCRDSASAVYRPACRRVHVPDPGTHVPAPGTHVPAPSPPAPGPFRPHTGGREGALRGLCAQQPCCEKLRTWGAGQPVLEPRYCGGWDACSVR